MKKQGKKKPPVNDLRNQSKITSYFQKTDIDKTQLETENNDIVSKSVDLTKVSSRRKRYLIKNDLSSLKNNKQNLKSTDSETPEVIILSESSSDSEYFKTTELKLLNVTMCTPAVSETQKTATNPRCNINKSTKEAKLNQCKEQEGDSSTEDEINFQSANVANLPKINDAETQIISKDEIFCNDLRNLNEDDGDLESESQQSPSLLQIENIQNDYYSHSPCLLTNVDNLEYFEPEDNNIIKSGKTSSQTIDGTILEEVIKININKKNQGSRQNSPSPSTNSTKTGNMIGLFTPPKEKCSSSRSPTKSPKFIATYFSPVRHLRKRSASNSPQRSYSQSTRSFAASSLDSPGFNSSTISKQSDYFANPYYYKNFIAIVDSVFSDPHYDYLISETDKNIIEKFRNLSKQAQCLYIRLFQRKWQWKQAVTIKYPLIAENLFPIFQELLLSHFVQDLKFEKQELAVVLDLLNGDQMSLLSKKMGTTGKTKEMNKEALLNMSRKQKTLFGSSSQVIYEEALKLLGATYKVTADSKNLFSRLFILHSPPQYWEDDSHQSSNQLLAILLVDMGKMTYPAYNINKTLQIYSSRDQLISFQESWNLHSELQSHVEAKSWEDVCSVGEECLSKLSHHFLKDEEGTLHNSNLPAFLRVYTSASVLTHTLWLSVQGHQKLRHYLKANEIIEFLLNQSVYLTHYRGRWHERLIINTKHLKVSFATTLKTLKNALEDKYAQDSHKYMLSNRYEKLMEENTRRMRKLSKNVKGKKATENNMDGSDTELCVTEDNKDNLYHLKHEVPTRTIQGEKLNVNNAERGASGFKSVFLGAKSASSVELYAMNFYMGQGYHTGVHGEGSVPVSLFGLLFWDVIYKDDIPDVFLSIYQPFPLDLHFENFYTQRIDIIRDKLQKLKLHWSMNQVLECVEKHWTENVNTVSIVNWSVFSSLEDVQSLIKSMGVSVIASICDRMAQNMRHYRSGFPDLVMWNGAKCIFVEVKGPGDSLSAKQSLWIDFLVTIGANVEVCNVKSVSNKRIKTK